MPGSGSSNPNGNVGGGWGADGSNSGGKGSFGSGGSGTGMGGQGGQGGQGSGGSYNANKNTPPGLTTGFVGAAGTNKGAWSGDGQNIGLTTGNDWYGNTAFGPSGGMATGYAMRDMQSLAQAGMGPMPGTYSNFRTLNNQPAFGNSPMQGGYAVGFPNANAAYAHMLQRYQNWLASQRPAGLLGDKVVQGPLPPMRPPAPEAFPPVPEEVVPAPPSVPVSWDRTYQSWNTPGINRAPAYRPSGNTVRMNNQGGSGFGGGSAGGGSVGGGSGGGGGGVGW